MQIYNMVKKEEEHVRLYRCSNMKMLSRQRTRTRMQRRMRVRTKTTTRMQTRMWMRTRLQVIRRHYERRGAAVSLFFTTKPCQLSNLSHTSTPPLPLPYHAIPYRRIPNHTVEYLIIANIIPYHRIQYQTKHFTIP